MRPPLLTPIAALATGIAASLVLHAAVLSIRFQFPEPRRTSSAAAMEVVIVNSKTRSAPAKAEVLAQANLDGGGNVRERRRVRTPSPALRADRAGNDVVEAQRRVQELEAQQRELLSRLQQQSAVAAPPTPPTPAAPVTAEKPVEEKRAVDLRNSALAMVRSLEGQVARQIEEYSQRPRRTFIGARAREFRFARYVEDWRMKIERIGNLNYPEAAKGRIYGSLRLSVSINADGTLAGLEVERSSGHQVLDRAAERIVRMAAPFASFPPDIRRDTDILVITRTWHFAPGDQVFAE